MVGDVTFRQISFRYGSRIQVFTDLNLTIPKGKVTAVVGKSGSGKTTLLALMQNIYPLQKGNIYIGDHDIKDVSSRSLRQIVSVVPQQVDLFAGNVIENIAVGEYEPDIRHIVSVCKLLDIYDFIEKMPDGFQTYLGENGATLSGGQKQRIAIARALYRHPQIIILDEATSSLDSISERAVTNTIEALRDSGKTIIIIAHRLSTVIGADKILVFSQESWWREGINNCYQMKMCTINFGPLNISPDLNNIALTPLHQSVTMQITFLISHICRAFISGSWLAVTFSGWEVAQQAKMLKSPHIDSEPNDMYAD